MDRCDKCGITGKPLIGDTNVFSDTVWLVLTILMFTLGVAMGLSMGLNVM